VPKLALFLPVLAMGAAGVWSLAIDEQPLPLQTPKVTSAEKRRLVKSFKGNQLSVAGKLYVRDVASRRCPAKRGVRVRRQGSEGFAA